MQKTILKLIITAFLQKIKKTTIGIIQEGAALYPYVNLQKRKNKNVNQRLLHAWAKIPTKKSLCTEQPLKWSILGNRLQS